MTEIEELISAAFAARERAYAPYSGFLVGAALATEEGRIYQGCNIENASYGASNCAERTAFFKAVSEGEDRFAAICIVGGKDGGEPIICAPCGICRQVMREFCDPETFQVILATEETRYELYLLKELLPCSFGPEHLCQAGEACGGNQAPA